jgi:para-nitrobenzyl esterase
MVWFEGGSFMTVSPAITLIGGLALARRGVILITVAYRVNVFGFHAIPYSPPNPNTTRRATTD